MCEQNRVHALLEAGAVTDEIQPEAGPFALRTSLRIEQAEIETLAAEIQSGVQHCVGPPFVSRGRAEHDSAGGPPSSHSFPPGRSFAFIGSRRRTLSSSTVVCSATCSASATS